MIFHGIRQTSKEREWKWDKGQTSRERARWNLGFKSFHFICLPPKKFKKNKKRKETAWPKIVKHMRVYCRVK